MIYMYNIKTGELIAYKSPVGEMWRLEPEYSFDGKQIVFVTVPLKIEHITGRLFSEKTIEAEDFNDSQIAVMEPDGKNVRKVTNTTGLKLYPSFSHSGRKIIFALQHDQNIRGVATYRHL